MIIIDRQSLVNWICTRGPRIVGSRVERYGIKLCGAFYPITTRFLGGWVVMYSTSAKEEKVGGVMILKTGCYRWIDLYRVPWEKWQGKPEKPSLTNGDSPIRYRCNQILERIKLYGN